MGFVVDWVVPDPAAFGARLADRLRLPRPDPDDERFVLLLTGGALRIAATGLGGRERIIAVTATRADGGGFAARDAAGAQLLGVGWATVDIERGAREVAARFGIARRALRPAAEDGWLGAAALVADIEGSSLVLLEPITEGRVAAALARFGEGPVGVYLGLPGPASGVVRPGPLGAGELVTGAPSWGPFAIVLALAAAHRDGRVDPRAGTIGR